MKPYFAYGSNLWRQQMALRCPEHRLLGTGILTGYRWIISARGYATVVPSSNDLVFGVIYSLSEADEVRLDLCEGVKSGAYYKTMLPVMTQRGDLRCLVYIDHVEEEGEPQEEYVERMRYGIRDSRLPSMYVESYLEKIVTWHGPLAACG